MLEENNFPPNNKIPELNQWCKKFAEYGLAPKNEKEYAGNLSFRTPIGFIITAAGTNLGNLDGSDFIEVLGADSFTKRVIARGSKQPSSESILHYAVYQHRKDINAIFHGHDEIILNCSQELDLPVTRHEKPFGSNELMQEVMRILAACNYVVLKNHGFLALGRTLEETGRLAIQQHEKAVEWQQSTAGGVLKTGS